MMDSVATHLRKIIALGSRHRFGIMSVAVSALLGVLSASLKSDSGLSVLNDVARWELPQSKEVRLSADVDTMLADPLFGGEPVITQDQVIEDETESSDETIGDEWRLIGIFFEGNTKHVVIFNDTTGKTELAQLGQTLPGGEELLTIRQNEIEILDTNERRWLSLFVDTSVKEQD